MNLAKTYINLKKLSLSHERPAIYLHLVSVITMDTASIGVNLNKATMLFDPNKVGTEAV